MAEKYFNAKADQLEVDLGETCPVSLTFERSHIEGKLKIPWADFVKSVREVVDEISIQSEMEGHRDGTQGVVKQTIP